MTMISTTSSAQSFSAVRSSALLRYILPASHLLSAAHAEDDTDSLPASVEGIATEPITADPPIPTDLPELISLGAVDKLDTSNLPEAIATKSWQETVVFEGVTLTLEIAPGELPTAASETSTSSSSSTSTHDASTTPRRDGTSGGPFAHDGDRKVAIVIGVFMFLVAFGVLGIVLLLLWRRKRATGSFFKPARYSLAGTEMGNHGGAGSSRMSEAALLSPTKGVLLSPTSGQGKDEVGRSVPQVEYFSATQLSRISEAQDSEAPYDDTAKGFVAVEENAGHHREPAGSRYSREGFDPRLITPINTSKWNEVFPSGQGAEGSFELSADSPVQMAALKRASQSQLEVVEEDIESGSGDTTPTQPQRVQSGFAPSATRERRSLTVTMSPTNSSSDILEDAHGRSRTNTASSYSSSHSERERGESMDTLTPIVTPAPSYRDRKPADWLLPSATKRFRDQRLPLVHFPDEAASPPVISPPFQNRRSSRELGPSPQDSVTKVSPLPTPGNALSPLPNGISPFGSPGGGRFPERRISPLGRVYSPSPSPVVHYPSREELSTFEFQNGSPPTANDDEYYLQPRTYVPTGGR